MAQRRMFSRKIVDTDSFLELSHNAQLLYFHLSLQADDDGFISSPKRILRMVNLIEDDLTELINKEFIIKFENGVCVVKHWLIHNFIQKDRYTGTLYLSEMKRLSKINGIYELINETDCIQDASNMETQVSLEKVSKGEHSEGEDNAGDDANILKIIDLYNKHCPNLPPILQISENRKKNILKLLESFSWESIETAFIEIGKSAFCNGKTGFKADLDFCLNPDRLLSAIEGKYKEHNNYASFADLDSRFEEYEIIGEVIKND
jgi:hypothetical protein